jgi:hypothetical protein
MAPHEGQFNEYPNQEKGADAQHHEARKRISGCQTPSIHEENQRAAGESPADGNNGTL